MSLHEDKFIYLRYCTNKSTLLNELPFTAEYDTTSGYTLNPSESSRDLGIQMSADYTRIKHIGNMVRGARNAASWVLGVFKNRCTSVMLQLYMSLVRCRVEYCCPLWKFDTIQKVEDIQRNFTRRFAGLQNLNYWQR